MLFDSLALLKIVQGRTNSLLDKIIDRYNYFDQLEVVFQVRAEMDGITHSFSCRADQTVLNAAEEAGVTLPSSCCSGVCTTCAAVITDGVVEQTDAMGVKGELQQQGYALLCVAFPRADLTLKAGQEDALYEAQFGQYQK